MSFAAPLFLLGLLLVPLGLWAYLGADRGRRRAAEAFAAPRMLDSVAPRRPGWRRHAPMAVYALAATVLAVALARPQATVAVPDERASVVLAIDGSSSMRARDVAPSRLAAVRGAATAFVDDVPDDLRVGAVIFDDGIRAAEAPSRRKQDARGVIATLRAEGGTAVGTALTSSVRLLSASRKRGERRPPAAVVLLSDGKSTHGRDPLAVAREAARQRIPVYTVALGTDQGTIQRLRGGQPITERVPPDRQTLREIARVTGGRYYEATDAPELDDVYEELGSRVSTRDEEREITAAFAAGAGLLLLGGGAASLRWFGRLP